MKIKFQCGHKGFGGHCHRCEQAKTCEDRANQIESKNVSKGWYFETGGQVTVKCGSKAFHLTMDQRPQIPAMLRLEADRLREVPSMEPVDVESVL